MNNSDDWFKDTFHRSTGNGRSRYGKGHRHYKNKPFNTVTSFTAANSAASVGDVVLPPAPRNTDIEDKLKKLGLLK